MGDDEPTGGDRPHVLLLAPMKSELRPLVRMLLLRRSPAPAGAGQGVVYEGEVGDVTVTAARTGVGMAPAAAVTGGLLDALPGVDHVVVVGIAGGIGPGQQIGDVVVPEVVVDGGTGAEHRPDPLGDQAPAGGLSTSDDLVVDPAELAAMTERGVVALDMETSAVATVCEDRGTRWSVFRAISDRPSDGLVDGAVAGLANADGSANPGAVLRFVLRHPGRIPHLARLGRDMKTATEAAATAAVQACKDVRSA
jgi:adenosylhomocysteine nucleosidase